MKLSVITDNNNIVIEYATVGKIEGGIEIEIDSVPNDLWRKYYKLIGGRIEIDEELKAQIEAAHSD